jgi:hypothetical protein
MSQEQGCRERGRAPVKKNLRAAPSRLNRQEEKQGKNIAADSNASTLQIAP